MSADEAPGLVEVVTLDVRGAHSDLEVAAVTEPVLKPSGAGEVEDQDVLVAVHQR